MRGKRKWLYRLALAVMLLLLPGRGAGAADKNPQSIRLDKVSVTALKGQSISLKAALSPKNVKNNKITWQSSNKKVAVIASKSGKKASVEIVGYGTAKIYARTKNKKYAVCTVNGIQSRRTDGKMSISTPDGVRTYKEYIQSDYGLYYRSYGCVATAVAIVASGYGKNYTPADIHEGSQKKKYSERYAIKKAKGSTSLYGRAAISVRTASDILTNMGIENKVTYKFTNAKAYREIKKNLKKGKPVIIKANDSWHNGIRLAHGHHAIVLVGLDSQENIIYINPGGGGNYKIKLKTLIKYHMMQAQGDYKAPYVQKYAWAGGYILMK